MSVQQSDVPEWTGIAGWFRLLAALVWLVDPTAFTVPMVAVTLLLAGCWLVGVYQHFRAVNTLRFDERRPR